MKICIDSRKVEPGDIFYCLEGVVTDGHKFADMAAEKGASVIVYQNDLPTEERDGVAYIRVKDTVAALNEACDSFYGHPSHKLKMFGVTGTNGKSTITNIIAQIYSRKELCGYIGTINMKLGNVVKAPDLTTPDCVTMHTVLKQMWDEGAKAAAIEVSAHGLSRGRVDSVDFDYAIFTNLTQDHLDYYHTMSNYFEAKQLLFKHLKPEGCAILNRDSTTFEALKACTKARVITYGIYEECDYRAEEIVYGEDCSSFVLNHNGEKTAFKTNMTAEYNIYNIVAAIAACFEAGVPMEDIVAGAEFIEQIPGRMERVDEGQKFRVIVDYAHTPDGFEKIFQYGKNITPEGGKLLGVFGCAGGRDANKRPKMGAMAQKYLDKAFLTSQDIRDEDPEDIANQIRGGFTELENVFIRDRKEAIETAIAEAGDEDTILILGKGDEAYLYGTKGREPWMGDNNCAREAVKMRMGK